MLPLECQYLNKNALTTLAGPLTPPVKHFQLKRKPKSATLRAELLQKCECRASVCPGLGRPGLGGGWGAQGWGRPGPLSAGAGAPCAAGPGRSCRLRETGCRQPCLLSHVSSFYSEVPLRFYGT